MAIRDTLLGFEPLYVVLGRYRELLLTLKLALLPLLALERALGHSQDLVLQVVDVRLCSRIPQLSSCVRCMV
jgi:hypothetical protein